MTPEHQQAEREARAAFENWHGAKSCFARMASTGIYANPVIESQWLAFQAALEWKAGERADVVPPGMVLVPIEPTDAMWDAAVAEQNRVEALAPGQHPSCFQIYKAMIAASQDSAKGGK